MFDHGRCLPTLVRFLQPRISSLLRIHLSRFSRPDTADYDNSKVWSRIQVWETICQAQDAMTAWIVIREREVAQEYLFDLLGARQ